MKWLEFPDLARLNSFLDSVDVGEYIVKGDMDCFSCKLAGFDKKLSRSLESEVQMELASSPEVSALGTSPVGPLSEASSRKTLIYLILTLNHIYPDYDFTVLRAHHFRREASGVSQAEEHIDEALIEVARVWESNPENGDRHFRDTLWRTVDEAVDLKDCDVYSYKSDVDSGPFSEEGSIWSFNYFFYNRKLKRILYFSCRGVSKAVGGDEDDSSSGYESGRDARDARAARDDVDYSFGVEGMDPEEGLSDTATRSISHTQSHDTYDTHDTAQNRAR